MSTPVVVSKIGFSMSEGTLIEWLADDGAEVMAGQPLYLLESDKSVQEIEAPASGMLVIIAHPGEIYKVGTILAEIA